MGCCSLYHGVQLQLMRGTSRRLAKLLILYTGLKSRVENSVCTWVHDLKVFVLDINHLTLVNM